MSDDLGRLERLRRRLSPVLGQHYEPPDLVATVEMLPEDPAVLTALYEENAKVSTVYWDWRHKLVTIFLSAMGALLVASGWLYDRGAGRWTAVPLLGGMLVAFHCIRLEARNHAILGDSYCVGAAIEKRLGRQAPTSELRRAGPIFTLLHDRGRRRYARQLRWVFVTIGAAMVLAAVAVLVWSPEPASDGQDEPAKTALAQLVR